MDLPQELLDRYSSVARKQTRQKPVEHTPMYRTFPVTIYFSDGTSEDMAFTAKNKAYWGGQLENDIKTAWNNKFHNGIKAVRVKVFRNSTPGGVMIRDNRVINVY